MHNIRMTGLAAAALLVALIGLPGAALAHERRTLGAGGGGKYEVVVGWDTEPAFVGQKNAAGIRISLAGTNPAQAVSGVENTLQVEIRQGNDARTFQLRTVFGQPGYYVADVVPTRAGDYAWTFSGSIGGDQVGETFNTADGRFDAVRAASILEFPVAAPDPAQVSADLESARLAAQSARTMGYAGLGAGALAIAGVLVLWLTRPRPLARRAG